jgi:hypothetical protein
VYLVVLDELQRDRRGNHQESRMDEALGDCGIQLADVAAGSGQVVDKKINLRRAAGVRRRYNRDPVIRRFVWYLTWKTRK